MPGQMRTISGPNGIGYVGFEMTAALQMARAMGLPGIVVADLLPLIERIAIPKLNEQLR